MYDPYASGREALACLRKFNAHDHDDKRRSLRIFADGLDLALETDIDGATCDDLLITSHAAQAYIVGYYPFLREEAERGFPAFRLLVSLAPDFDSEADVARVVPAHEIRQAHADVRFLASEARAWADVWPPRHYGPKRSAAWAKKICRDNGIPF